MSFYDELNLTADLYKAAVFSELRRLEAENAELKARLDEIRNAFPKPKDRKVRYDSQIIAKICTACGKEREMTRRSMWCDECRYKVNRKVKSDKDD